MPSAYEIRACEHKRQLFKDSNSVRPPFSPTGRRSHPYLVRARRSYRGSAPPPAAELPEPPRSPSLRSLHRSPFRSLTPPNPDATLAGASLNVSGFVASFSKSSSAMHESAMRVRPLLCPVRCGGDEEWVSKCTRRVPRFPFGSCLSYNSNVGPICALRKREAQKGRPPRDVHHKDGREWAEALYYP